MGRPSFNFSRQNLIMIWHIWNAGDELGDLFSKNRWNCKLPFKLGIGHQTIFKYSSNKLLFKIRGLLKPSLFIFYFFYWGFIILQPFFLYQHEYLLFFEDPLKANDPVFALANNTSVCSASSNINFNLII